MPEILDLTFAALADHTRREILMLLVDRDRSVGEIANRFPMSLAAVSKHLSTLSRAGIVKRERKGRVILCKLEPNALRDGLLWMESLGQIEAVNLDAFEKFLSAELGDQCGK